MIALLPFILLWVRMSHFKKLTVAELPKATEEDLQKMRSASKTAFFIMLACTVLSFLPYGFTYESQAAAQTGTIFMWGITIFGVVVSSIFDQKAHNIKKRCQSDIAKSAERGQLRWYHVVVSILLPYVGLPWGIINLITKRRKSGLVMTIISGIWILVFVIIMLAASSHAK